MSEKKSGTKKRFSVNGNKFTNKKNKLKNLYQKRFRKEADIKNLKKEQVYKMMLDTKNDQK